MNKLRVEPEPEKEQLRILLSSFYFAIIALFQIMFFLDSLTMGFLNNMSRPIRQPFCSVISFMLFFVEILCIAVFYTYTKGDFFQKAGTSLFIVSLGMIIVIFSGGIPFTRNIALFLYETPLEALAHLYHAFLG